MAKKKARKARTLPRCGCKNPECETCGGNGCDIPPSTVFNSTRFCEGCADCAVDTDWKAVEELNVSKLKKRRK